MIDVSLVSLDTLTVKVNAYFFYVDVDLYVNSKFNFQIATAIHMAQKALIVMTKENAPVKEDMREIFVMSVPMDSISQTNIALVISMCRTLICKT